MFMTESERRLSAAVYLLEQEIDCLRSVLSEWEEDKSCYIQWNRAEDLRRVIESMRLY